MDEANGLRDSRKLRMKSLKDQFRENPYKFSTLILAIAVTVLIIFWSYPTSPPGEFDEVEICKEITGTPAWVNPDGTVGSYGFKDFGESSPEYMVKLLTQEEMHFFYSPNCGWCHKQIEWFNKSWWDYGEAGLTHDCNEVLGVGK